MKPRRTKRKKPAPAARKKVSRAPVPSIPLKVDQVIAARELFWQNVLREMLTSLAAVPQQLTAATDEPATTEASAAAGPDQSNLALAPEPDANLFDGRLAIITRAGERIPIAAVFPLFACGASNPNAREASLAVECTVFQIRTPDGHVFTIPLHEIRAFHALSPELMDKLERSARRRAAKRDAQSDDDAPPFGFAAFTSIARGLPDQPPEPAPSHPME